MGKYLLIYHGGGMPDSEEEQAKHMEAWGQWMGGIGEAFTDMGNPIGPSKTVGPDGVVDGGGANPASGYGIVEAGSIDAAAEMAKGCPIVVLSGGTVEVAETFEIPM
jgi:hypothetical protein